VGLALRFQRRVFGFRCMGSWPILLQKSKNLAASKIDARAGAVRKRYSRAL
jgi:hypothetical protein